MSVEMYSILFAMCKTKGIYDTNALHFTLWYVAFFILSIQLPGITEKAPRIRESTPAGGLCMCSGSCSAVVDGAIPNRHRPSATTAEAGDESRIACSGP
jgi:hypothetical protein